VPSGILREDVTAVLGNGTVIDPAALVDELDRLEEANALNGELVVADNAHVVFPHHQRLDAAHEEGEDAIGTTKRGIGPTYASKMSRFNARLGDLVRSGPDGEVIERALRGLERRCKAEGVEAPSREEVREWYEGWRDRLAPHVGDASGRLLDAIEGDEEVVLEGAQGTLLDVDHGTYPFVTSSNPTSGGACVGTGVPPTAVDEVVGIAKAYVSRVGEGPFPSELDGEAADHLVEVGNEYGTTTGRRRRVGWLDLVALRRAARINGFTAIALTNVDVLEGLDQVEVCTAYRLDGEKRTRAPASAYRLGDAEPVTEPVEGSFEGAGEADTYRQLPEGARNLVERVEGATGVDVTIVSNGPDRRDTIDRT
jgi:adenylosuccinate synthase